MPCRLPNTKRHGRYTSSIMTLAFLRRPAISLGAGTAHQRRALALAQAVGETEGLDGLFVVDDRECAGPVGAPQTTVEALGVEHAGERIPDVWKRIGFLLGVEPSRFRNSGNLGTSASGYAARGVVMI